MFSLNSVNSVTKIKLKIKRNAVFESTTSCVRDRDEPNSCFSDFSDSLNSLNSLNSMQVLLQQGKTAVIILQRPE